MITRSTRFNLAAIDARRHSVPVEFDLVYPLSARRELAKVAAQSSAAAQPRRRSRDGGAAAHSAISVASGGGQLAAHA
jgi:hypothetical protein